MKYARGRCRFGHHGTEHGTEQHGTEQQKRAKGLRLRDQDLRPQNSRTKVFCFFLGNFQILGNFPKVAFMCATSLKIGNFREKRRLLQL